MLFYAAALQTLNYDWDTLVVWVLGLLGGVLATGILDGKLFTVALLSSYSLAQMLEALRHRNLIRSR